MLKEYDKILNELKENKIDFFDLEVYHDLKLSSDAFDVELDDDTTQKLMGITHNVWLKSDVDIGLSDITDYLVQHIDYILDDNTSTYDILDRILENIW